MIRFKTDELDVSAKSKYIHKINYSTRAGYSVLYMLFIAHNKTIYWFHLQLDSLWKYIVLLSHYQNIIDVNKEISDYHQRYRHKIDSSRKQEVNDNY